MSRTITLLAMLLLVTCNVANAHPPKFHRQSSAVAVVQESPQPLASVSELDRQMAFFQFEFLADVAQRCPISCQRDVVRQLIEEQRLAAQLHQAIPRDQLVASRGVVARQLRDRFVWFDATWSRDGLRWSQKPRAIEVATGLSRFVVVELHNATETSLNLNARSGEQIQTANPLTVLPGKSQPFLIEVNAAQPNADLTFTAGEVSNNLSVAVTAVAPAKLRGKLLDGDTQMPVPGRVWVEGSDHQLRRAGPFATNKSFMEKPILELPSMRMAAVPFFYADGQFEIDVPPGRTTVTLERGFEHPLVTEAVELQPGEVREVTLSSRRFLDAKANGWISGDTHIHWVTNAWNVDLPLSDLAVVQRAEDVRVVNNLTLLHRTTTEAFIKPSQAPVGPVLAHSDRDYHIEMAEEYRNQNLYGHLCFLNLQWLVLPIGTGPQIAGDDSLDYPLNKTAILEARGQGGISIEAHGIGANHELPLNAVHGLTDSVDQIDPVDYYRLLNCGFQIPLTNGSDHPARIAGCARAYVQIDGEFDYEKWIDGIRCGRTFTTSGPLLFLTVDDQGSGSVLAVTEPRPVTARVKAISRFPLGRVQIVSNGVVLKETETQEREITIECSVPADQSRWVVARCSRSDRWNALWQPDIAHTSAIYIHRDGQPVFRAEAAAEWVDRMRLHSRDILTKGLFASVQQRNEATAYVAESIRRYGMLVDMRRSEGGNPEFAPQRDRLLMQSAFASHLGHDPTFVTQISEAAHVGNLRTTTEPLTLFRVHINPESRVKLAVVTPPETVVQHRTQRFLVEIHNEARIRAPLQIRAIDRTASSNEPPTWCSIRLVENLLSTSLLTGEEHEWKLMELRCSETGHREVHLEVDAGQGTQDLGFRAAADLLLKCVPRREHRTLLKPAIR